MATGIFADKDETDQIRNNTIVSGEVNEDGDLILTQYDGTQINAGFVKGSATAEAVEATPHTLAKRDAGGRTEVAAPVEDQDAVNLLFLNTLVDSVGSSAATPNALIRRDAEGQAKVEDPIDTKDIVNLQTLDNRVKLDNAKKESDLPGTFVYGITITDAGTTGSTNWFTALATVVTYKFSGTRAYQILTTKGNPAVMYYRAANDAAVAWYGWSQIATKAQLDAQGALKVGRINVVAITATGAGTYTKPANLIAALVECQGGGAGAGATPATAAGQVAIGNGGAGGGYTRKLYLAADLSATEAYVVGTGGAGTPSTSPTAVSTAGGNTTFKGLTANGGGGSNSRGPASNNFGPGGTLGSGGAATGGDSGWNIPGTTGGGGWFSTGGVGMGGPGGKSQLGMPGEPFGGHGGSTWDTGDLGAGFGQGAPGGFAGASQSAHSGIAGKQGVIYITEYLSA